MKKENVIAIAGLGLMGGSLAAAIRRKMPRARVVGISRSRSALRYALRRGWIHQGETSFRQGISKAGTIVLCTPVHTIAGYVREAEKFAPEGALVTDVGSVKGAIEKSVSSMSLKRVMFAGAHPMVGSHEQGVTAAKPDLYDGGLIFLVRSRKANLKAVKAARQFWKKFTSRIVEIPAAEHDLIVAGISHLPHAVAACLLHTVPEKNLFFAGAGFRDSTRIGASHPAVWTPIFLANRESLEKAFKQFEARLSTFRKALRKGNAKALARFLEESRRRRLEI